MHSSSQGGSMAATLIQQKSFNLNGSPGSAGSGADGTNNDQAAVAGTSVASVVGGPAAGGGVKSFLPVSKTLIHHLLPTHQHQADHHTAATTLLQRGHGSPGAFVVLSSPTLGAHSGNHRIVQHRTNRGTSSLGAFNSPVEPREHHSFEEIFEPLPHQADLTVPQPSDVGTGCVWDVFETPETAEAAIGQRESPGMPTDHVPMNHQTVPAPVEELPPEVTGNAPNDVPCDGLVADVAARVKEDPMATNADEADEQEAEPEPEIDIVINNVVCSFSVRCHLNLHEIALNGDNVEFRRENGMVTMKLRRPYTTASIWSSGKITCTGATSEEQAKIAARRYSRCLQKLGFDVRLRNFRIVNVLGTCSMPWGIKIVNFSEKYKKDASYEPELHPGVTYKLHAPRATLKIFSTGSITVTAASVAFVQAAIEHIFPLVFEFRKKRTQHEKLELLKPPPAFDAQDDFDMVAEDGDEAQRARAVGMEADDPDGDAFEMADGDDADMRTNPGKTKAIDKSNSIRSGCSDKRRSGR